MNSDVLLSGWWEQVLFLGLREQQTLFPTNLLGAPFPSLGYFLDVTDS